MGREDSLEANEIRKLSFASERWLLKTGYQDPRDPARRVCFESMARNHPASVHGELDLIARIRERSGTRNRAVRVGIGDDCAILRVPAGSEMVVTTDFSLEGRHFRRDWHTPESVGHRCLARGLSDIAAMGARPLAAFLSLAMPAPLDVRWVDGFVAGFGALAELWGTQLAGGDTSQAPGAEILADVVVTGAVGQGRALRRSGARAGDGIYVTGTLGGSAAELVALAEGRLKAKRQAGKAGRHPHLFPEPRVGVGQALLRRGLATACMDLSDGLSSDVRRICEASGVGAEVEATRIPLGVGATLEQALSGGEDYELLFTAGEQVPVPGKIAGIAVTRVGRITRKSLGIRLLGADGFGRELTAGGWEHFHQ